MPIVGFNLTKLNAVKKNQITKSTKLEIKAKLGIKDVNEEELPIGKVKNKGLKFTFEYHLNYEPDIANIEIEGYIYYLEDQKTIEEITKYWKDKKDVPTEIKQQILNTVVLKATIKALSLEQEINIPPHIPFPTVQPAKKKENYIG